MCITVLHDVFPSFRKSTSRDVDYPIILKARFLKISKWCWVACWAIFTCLPITHHVLWILPPNLVSTSRPRIIVILCASWPVLSIICQARGFPRRKECGRNRVLSCACVPVLSIICQARVSRAERNAAGTESCRAPLCRFYLLFVKLGVSRDERSAAGTEFSRSCY